MAVNAFGPYNDLGKASEEAYMLVGGGPVTMWSVVEIFGPGYETSCQGIDLGETWGTLFVIPTDDAEEFREEKEAESIQILDTYGYEAHEIEPPTDDQIREDELLVEEHNS